MQKRIEALEAIARDVIGDGKRPNMFFVSVKGNIQMITTEYAQAINYWRSLPRNMETCLEDRLTGVIADTSPIEDNSPTLRTYDGPNTYRAMI